ncbi:DUF2759 domain-containing protein [Pseudalkalibacillus salsuginis]|uniref:DUF2759 domain-containing protein n=1 Tax=Pseudalkalibacillus salsuginis TaxID=2910972 RepID=UPI001F3DEDD2|nr:DUF2759 domain-containing protein [Pseudalkalibacillus salsuginis]MCF6408457.1 DUF2759 domain-containing protein [Pseudalkalibacillus salsuginis]
MALAIIFGLVTLFAIWALFREFKRKNIFALGFAFLTVAVFGWFTVMTVIDIFHTGGWGGGH